MSYTSRQAAQESQQVERSANKVVSPKFTDQRASTSVQLKQQQLMQTAKSPAQLAAEEEEPLQGKFVAQRVEEEEPLQGKFVAQRAEEEELLQGKFATAQLAGIEEEEPIQGKFSNTATAQLEEKPNNTGLPNQLKSGIESLSGMSLDGVKVHYNSDKPAQLNAHAYAQGTDIHVAPGQEQHLPHEAWHVVQQAQGRVKPTTQMKGTSVNDDVGLETEADVMGAKALQLKSDEYSSVQRIALPGTAAVQLYDVVRGGTCTAEQFSGGSGVTVGAENKLSGVSTQSKDGVDRNTLCGFFRNGQVGIADSSAITGAGGELVHDGGRSNPNHATVNGLTAAKLNELFTPTIANPNKKV
jgi:hypothetical protein